MEKFNIVFSGQLKDGWTKEQVILELGKLFKVDPVGLGKKIFINSSVVLKKDLTLEQAQKYEAAMAERGALVIISNYDKSDEGLTADTDHEGIRAIEAKLAKVGALLIEPIVDKPADFDISHLSLLEAGVTLIEPIPPIEPQYNLEKFQIKKLDE